MTELPLILCVDDEQSTLDSLDRVLRKDFRVLKAANGSEALEVVKANPELSIILSDYRMPGMTGVQFLTEARKVCPNAIRAILSGQIDLNEMMVAINNLEIHRFILKPWDNDYLKLQMLEALQNHDLLQQKNHLQHLAITDPVTQLYNHRHFQEQLRVEIERAVRHQRPVSLIMIDVDHFKSFNDHYGHPEGDRLLRSVAERISTEVRTIDTVCRYGGEEFAVVMPDTPVMEARLVAERVRASLETQAFTGPFDRPAYVTISLGVAGMPQHGEEASAIIAAADRALYQAKRQGRNQTVVAS